ncbi:MAG TPA: type II secretion system protein GspG [Acidobacteriota bacterium]|nr:type II secretion system protein GspG [Acidobacteriota bacterium]
MRPSRIVGACLFLLLFHGCRLLLHPHGGRGSTKSDVALVQIQELAGALELFHFDTGRYPTSEEGLKALIDGRGTEGWMGPYLNKESLPADPWGSDYIYRRPGRSGDYDLMSLGADGQAGGVREGADIILGQPWPPDPPVWRQLLGWRWWILHSVLLLLYFLTTATVAACTRPRVHPPPA